MGETVTNRLKDLRLERGLSGTKIAEALGISSQYYYDLEKGDRRLNEDHIKQLAEFYKVTSDYIIGITNSRKAESSTTSTSLIPERFTSPEEARAYVEKHVILGANGINPYKFDDEKILEFANEMLEQMKLISYKYKK